MKTKLAHYMGSYKAIIITLCPETLSTTLILDNGHEIHVDNLFEHLTMFFLPLE